MKLKKLHLYLAGLVAFLLGFPLTEKAFGQDGNGNVGGEVGDLVNAAMALSGGNT